MIDETTNDTNGTETAEHEESLTIISDFSELDTKAASEAGATLHLRHPATGELLYLSDKSPATIDFLGVDSAKMRAYHRKITDRRLEQSREQRAGKKMKNPVTAATLEREKAEGLATVTRGWNIFPIDGKTLSCTEQNATKLYSDPRFLWVGEQADEFIAERLNFFKTASSN
jgi:hypothetical protein